MLSILKNYKLIIQPLLAVLVLDVLLLVSNYYIAAELQVIANHINIAGRQRMLSQNVAKEVSLLFIDEKRLYSQLDTYDHKLALNATVGLFHQTLSAFRNGGWVVTAADEKLFIQKLKHPEAQRILTEADTLWEPMYSELGFYLQTEQSHDSRLESLLVIVEKHNRQLLKLMNDLTNHLEQDAKSRTYFLRALQAFVVLMIFVSFFIATIRLGRRENYYSQLMEKTTDIVLSVNVKTNEITFISASVQKLLGYEPNDLINQSSTVLFANESVYTFPRLLEHLNATGRLDVERCEVDLRRIEGSILHADMVLSITESEDGQSLELSADVRDITERKKAELALAELAHKDVLTGLPNRILFDQLAKQAIVRANRSECKVAILFVDLDGFKKVNDKYGHEVGDQVLIDVAKGINHCLRASDSVSRLGGDEFVILLDEIKDRDEVTPIATKIINTIADQRIASIEESVITASVGIALYPDNAMDIAELISLADKAMYHVKRTGKNSIGFV